MRTYHYYSKKCVSIWAWGCCPKIEFTEIVRVVINDLKDEFKKIFMYLRIASKRVFTHTKK